MHYLLVVLFDSLTNVFNNIFWPENTIKGVYTFDDIDVKVYSEGKYIPVNDSGLKNFCNIGFIKK